MALDLKTGYVAWAAHTLPGDVSTNFIHDEGPDYDFGQGPILFTTEVDGRPMTLLGVGQKSGVYWALDPTSGRVVWRTEVGPGSRLGGMMWGSAADGRRIYVSIGNGHHDPVTIPSDTGKPLTTTGGFWAALDAATGKILWRTPDPRDVDVGALTVGDGVVYAGSMAPRGENMYALDAATGALRWSFSSGGSVAGGPAVVGGAVYWGSGYRKSAASTGATTSSTLSAWSANSREQLNLLARPTGISAVPLLASSAVERRAPVRRASGEGDPSSARIASRRQAAAG